MSGQHYLWSPSLVTVLDDDWRPARSSTQGDAERLAATIDHSLPGMVVQRMALDDWTSKAMGLKSVLAVTLSRPTATQLPS